MEWLFFFNEVIGIILWFLVGYPPTNAWE